MVAAPVRGAVEQQLDQLKNRLLRPVLEKISCAELVRELSWAANEAAGQAWQTVCPILVLPTLLEERLHECVRKWNKQQQVRSL